MKTVFNKKSASDKNQLLIDHKSEKNFLDFLNSKLEAMEKINLDDECLFETEIETKKLNKNKNVLRKSKHLKSIKCSNSTKKIKNSKNKSSNKNTIVSHNGKIEKAKIENIDSVDVTNLDVKKEIKEKDLNKFFSSNKTLLISILDEMKNK